MVSHEVYEGLRQAILRGESLNEAMISFYNSGYDRAEIEDAARQLMIGMSQLKDPTQMHKTSTVEYNDKKKQAPSTHSEPSQERRGIAYEKEEKKKDEKEMSPYKQQAQELPQQKISGYGVGPKKRFGFKIVLVIFIFIILIAILGGVIVFKDTIIDFFNNLV